MCVTNSWFSSLWFYLLSVQTEQRTRPPAFVCKHDCHANTGEEKNPQITTKWIVRIVSVCMVYLIYLYVVHNLQWRRNEICFRETQYLVLKKPPTVSRLGTPTYLPTAATSFLPDLFTFNRVLFLLLLKILTFGWFRQFGVYLDREES